VQTRNSTKPEKGGSPKKDFSQPKKSEGESRQECHARSETGGKDEVGDQKAPNQAARKTRARAVEKKTRRKPPIKQRKHTQGGIQSNIPTRKGE